MELSAIFAFLGNLGGPEIFLIVLFVLIFFGAKKIPELARGLGKGIKEFKDATREVQNEIEDSVKDEPKKAIK
ncbi:twin-arginine translocase TatA/TatE family subunit [Cytophagaceae bacterium DM2B3-1]|uniref:Sec-independent protein translocase protein TatA n=2 Tax=Xanthocytophaga TaxID=3078918 RepID=A0AAE3UBY7_9BACT|nr:MULTISPECIES: twin-arginine translocase TatA/TatE family subunit [Xanthocytophaga]MDJ1467090.1 twin-arginine translocase TatA/TatE family subunit [Xanthocytophaga flavus]MDJ1484908.1 twin-arginine translocase TatA/TatE family subunit [Xanthocytophaga flavus]MDJ1497414.1 twin-arginine translocase TatA/TatE family subunit [Xanthocytophaga flavus]MDJ1506719.1 twin-arginine translocase TatA/TatE family subunit [Xanthocytophaga agilis]